MQQALVFDFDGTLAESFPRVRRLLEVYAPKYGLPVPDDVLLAEWRNLSLPEFMEKYHLSALSVARITKHIRKDLASHMAEIPIFAEVKTMLEALHQAGIALFVVSSNSRKNLEHWLNLQGMRHLFTDVVGDVSMLGKKSKLKKIMRRHKLDAQNLFMVGDEVRDIEAAHAVGCRSIAVTWGFQSLQRLQQTHPTYVVTTPEELLTSLKVQTA